MSVNLHVGNRMSVLITGCSPGGIGHALAREFHRNGLRVFATARKRQDIADLEDEGIETWSLVVDDDESVKSCYAEIKTRLKEKGLDYLGSKSGAPIYGLGPIHTSQNGRLRLALLDCTIPAADVDLAEARATFDTNFFAVINICQTFLPLLIQARGTIVQIGSIAGVIPYVFGSVYNASKAALHSFSDSLRVELAPFGVKVVTIITGGVQSRISRNEQTLAPSSLYHPVASEYARRVQHSQEGAMASDVFARSVVSQLLYGSAPWRWLRPWLLPAYATPKSWIWEGNRIGVLWLLTGGWTWWGLFDGVFTRMFNLWKLKGTI
ncbi:hypothetical protein Egran_00395 [Elaphomyces granulatus]|uniref:Uncharacterized protein n=1 Tax=Elaphomyces granulatus TaxID=519963 RepID=A0A232M6C1_9EURO|nr:hypothetical protein Egran_00395 [Elaphomyces granulatus]